MRVRNVAIYFTMLPTVCNQRCEMEVMVLSKSEAVMHAEATQIIDQAHNQFTDQASLTPWPGMQDIHEQTLTIA